MKAVTYTAYGPATDVLTVTPDFPDAVLLRVHAAGLNPVDHKRIAGTLRPFFPPPSASSPAVPGMDVAGVVTATSAVAVAGEPPPFPVGTRVFGCIPGGALADAVAAPASLLAAIPDGVSFVDAAATPLACLTVLQCLRRLQGQVGAGPDRVIPSLLVTAGAGGTGSFAVQLAKRILRVPRVVTTVSGAKVAVATALGADEVMDYQTMPVRGALTGARRVAAALDAVGSTVSLLPTITPGGAVVSIGGPLQAGELGPWLPAGVPLYLRVALALLCAPVAVAAAVAGVAWSSLLLESKGSELADVAAWLADGSVVPLIDSVHDGLDGARAAYGVLMGGHATGKVVVRVVAEGG